MILRDSPQPPLTSAQFDLNLALALGAHAFDAYNDPAVGTGKRCEGFDSTALTFSSTEFIKRTFKGLIVGVVRKGQFKAEKEGDLMERIVTGGLPDTYVRVSLDETSNTRTLENFRSKVKKNDNMPEWQEPFSLYVRGDPDDATLRFHVFDEDLFKEDNLVGVGEVSLKQFLASSRENDKSVVELPVPIYTISKVGGWFGLGGSRKRKGTVLVELQYVDFGATTAHSSSPPEADKLQLQLQQQQRRRITVPKGASPGEADWEGLVSSRIRKYVNSSSGEDSSLDSKDGPGRALLRSMGSGLHQVCTIDNTETDTQGSVWVDYDSRLIVLSFRGTEQIKVKDVLTDINLVQADYFTGPVHRLREQEGGSSSEHKEIEELTSIRVHRGFLSAFRSIQPAVLQLLDAIMAPTHEATLDTDKENEQQLQHPAWQIYLTGHSLGGALASLMTFDLARIARGYRMEDDNSKSSIKSRDRGQAAALGFLAQIFGDDWEDPASSYLRSSSSLISALHAAELISYTYGAPRVGNPAYRSVSDEIAPHQFRVVNDRDVVPRVPRSSTANRLLEYSHAGRTVALSFNGSRENIWVEGESEGVSPTQEVNPFAAFSDSWGLPSSLLQRDRGSYVHITSNNSNNNNNDDDDDDKAAAEVFDLEAQVASMLALHPGAASAALSSIADRAVTKGQGLLLSKLPALLKAAGVDDDDVRRLDGLYKAAREVGGGVQSRFVEREFEMLASILDQRAIAHHLEPSYFQALLAQVEKDAVERGRNC
jgi:hypothetical protein